MNWLLIFFFALPLLAQSGDKPGEVQPPPPADLVIPPAPPLSPEEALKSFRIQPGFQIEVVASEPMIEAPVEIEFAPDGRLYVLEMRGFMPNVDGKGEDIPNGRVSLLEDTNHDGVMDKHTVFAEGLLMPRAIGVVRGGLLIAEPPHLWFFQDTDGDGKADKKEEISNDYGNQSNPEHNANGLLWGRDNWIYSANHTVRYKNIDGTWRKEGTITRGQWGISQDDYGRLFFNSNSDQLRADLVPAHYLSRNPHFKSPAGANVQIARDQSTYPIRVNPGVNRGYQKGTLRSDGTLARFTGACGPAIYRGELFPPQYYGAAFLCEPTANLVRCNFLQEKEGIITATNAFPNSEFLASTDERFRPVNIANGPDGALYVVDMYRGVIQHRIYLTSFLRKQALERGLDNPLNQGRIYRIVPVGAKRTTPKKLTTLSGPELVQQLNSTNGWTRDTVQQLLVEKAGGGALPELQALAAQGKFPAAIHALWVLHALDQLTAETLLSASKSPHEKVRATAIRTGERYLRVEGRNPVQSRFLELAGDPSTAVQLQLMFSLGESQSREAEDAMLRILEGQAENALVRSAALSGLKDREFAFLERLVARVKEKTPGREDLITDLARCVAEKREGEALNQLLTFAAEAPSPWVQLAVLDGISAIAPKSRSKNAAPPKPIRLASKPTAWDSLKHSASPEVQKRLAALEPLIVWPGKSGFEEKAVKPLTEAEQALFNAGREQYPILCGACHQPNGQGLEGLAPPLADSEWVTGSPELLTRIVLNGARGPMTVKGKVWELEMPAMNVLSDEELAALITYVRREWGHTASAVTPDYVKKIREATGDRQDAWTEAELLKLK